MNRSGVSALGLAVRLEAFYQHYARHAFMSGTPPLDRSRWLEEVVYQDTAFAAFMVGETDQILPGSIGDLL